MNWFTMNRCRDGARKEVHCKACRTDEKWRDSLFNLNLVNEINFHCPIGYTADNLPRKSELLGGALDHEKEGAKAGRVSSCCSPPEKGF